MNINQLLARCVLLCLIIGINACVVVPKEVATYDSKCKVATQRVSLDVKNLSSNGIGTCTNEDCAWNISGEIGQALFTTATSAIVSASIAIAGNTRYLLEGAGECPNYLAEQEQSKKTDESSTNQISDDYILEEEVITAKF